MVVVVCQEIFRLVVISLNWGGKGGFIYVFQKKKKNIRDIDDYPPINQV